MQGLGGMGIVNGIWISSLHDPVHLSLIVNPGRSSSTLIAERERDTSERDV
jgi:hypothetical protein